MKDKIASIGEITPLTLWASLCLRVANLTAAYTNGIQIYRPAIIMGRPDYHSPTVTPKFINGGIPKHSHRFPIRIYPVKPEPFGRRRTAWMWFGCNKRQLDLINRNFSDSSL